MMKHVILGVALLAAGLFPARGAEPPAKYRMEVVTIADATPREEVVVIVFPGGGFAFKTLLGLERFVAGLPKDSSLEWAPGCDRRGRDAGGLLSSAEQVAAFRTYCKKRGVNFVLIPSG